MEILLEMKGGGEDDEKKKGEDTGRSEKNAVIKAVKEVK